jgi:hypothetical protein
MPSGAGPDWLGERQTCLPTTRIVQWRSQVSDLELGASLGHELFGVITEPVAKCGHCDSAI